MAIAFSLNMATIPKDGTTQAVLYCTYNTATGAITGRFVRMVHWNSTLGVFVEDTPSPLDMTGPYLGWAATGAIPF